MYCLQNTLNIMPQIGQRMEKDIYAAHQKKPRVAIITKQTPE